MIVIVTAVWGTSVALAWLLGICMQPMMKRWMFPKKDPKESKIYYVPLGEVYHSDRKCRTLDDSRVVTERRICKVCCPPKLSGSGLKDALRRLA